MSNSEPIRITCPECGREALVKASLAGKRIRCPEDYCDEIIAVPDSRAKRKPPRRVEDDYDDYEEDYEEPRRRRRPPSIERRPKRKRREPERKPKKTRYSEEVDHHRSHHRSKPVLGACFLLLGLAMLIGGILHIAEKAAYGGGIALGLGLMYQSLQYFNGEV